MGGAAQAAAEQALHLQAQAREHCLGGAGAAGHTFRQHQQAPGLALPPTAPQPFTHGPPPGYGSRGHGGTAAEALGRGQPQAQVGHRRRHGTAGIQHQGRKSQGLQRHPTNQSRTHPRRQGRQGMGPLGHGPQQQQFGIGRRRKQP